MKRLLSLASCSLVGRLGGEFWAQACAPKPKTNDNNRLITPVIRHPPACVRSGCNYPKSTLKTNWTRDQPFRQGADCLKSALGQKQTYALQKAMSALHPIATSIASFGMSALDHWRTFVSASWMCAEGKKR